MVATIDRLENLLIPQTPWPEVHPLPILVPNPTRKPATTNKGIEEEITKINEISDEITESLPILVKKDLDLFSSTVNNKKWVLNVV